MTFATEVERSPLSDQLLDLVNRQSLESVLSALQDVCDDRSEFARTMFDDPQSAELWIAASTHVGALAEHTGKMGL